MPPPPDYKLSEGGPFFALHLLPLLAIFTGTTWVDWAVCFGLFFLRMFAITGFYHRYFSHRTFKTSRWFQLVMAVWAMSSSQKGVMWWASTHRQHHKYSDLPWDPHSPAQRGLFYAHVGWIFDRNHDETDMERVKDLARYPELVWLGKHWMVPPIALGVLVWWFLGWSGLLIGFMLSTALLWHGTYTINSLSHVFGTQRFESGDTSRNNWALALLTLGEGWHNNHHTYQGSTRQGFYWWEVDITYYGLKLLSWVGLIWELREPPAKLLEEGRRRDAAKRRGEPRLPEVGATDTVTARTSA
ncbi:MAG: acyl-CoA desaturase [Myxococcales bacterium]|nr:acyl-CoA desaturase [Myxococcales bacterium]